MLTTAMDNKFNNRKYMQVPDPAIPGAERKFSVIEATLSLLATTLPLQIGLTLFIVCLLLLTSTLWARESIKTELSAGTGHSKPATAARHIGHSITDLPSNAGAAEILKARAIQAGKFLRSGRLLWGDPNFKEVALTFDDGPHPPFTPGFLDLLRQLKVHATFFVVGRKVDQDPALLRRIVQEGHEIANHTYHHFNLKTVPAELVESEMRLDNDAIRRASGQTPQFFRPSGGQFNADVVLAAQRLGMTMALWTDDPGDYDPELGSAVIETRLLRHVRPGAVILLHDGMPQTEAMLPDFVNRLRGEGYRFVTLSEMVQRIQAAQDFKVPAVIKNRGSLLSGT